MKYRKKPVEIEAVQWKKLGDHPKVAGGNPNDEAVHQKCGKMMKEHGWTMRGVLVCPGDWIIEGGRDADDQFQCDNESFLRLYE